MSGERKRILLAEPEPVLAEITAFRLELLGYQVTSVQSAEEALTRVGEVDPDLIIADINLGDDNGLELCREIRALPHAAEIPVIFLSGAEISDIVRRSHEAGGTYFVRKPFDPEVLLQLVETSLWMPHVVRNRARHLHCHLQRAR